eukprot:2494460-Rhodomonas_salina.1
MSHVEGREVAIGVKVAEQCGRADAVLEARVGSFLNVVAEDHRDGRLERGVSAGDGLWGGTYR